MALKTIISLSKRNGELHNTTIEFEDATVEAITEAAILLLQRHHMEEGDSIRVGTIHTYQP